MNPRRQRAQTLVECAVVLPLFLVLVFGLLQFALWIRWADMAQVAAHEAAMTASGAYLAQYRPGTYAQAVWPTDAAAAWASAEAVGLQRGQEVLDTARIVGGPQPTISLTLREEGIAPGVDGERSIQATVSVWMPSLGLAFLPRVPGLNPWTVRSTVRPTRFYSF